MWYIGPSSALRTPHAVQPPLRSLSLAWGLRSLPPLPPSGGGAARAAPRGLVALAPRSGWTRAPAPGRAEGVGLGGADGSGLRPVGACRHVRAGARPCISSLRPRPRGRSLWVRLPSTVSRAGPGLFGFCAQCSVLPSFFAPRSAPEGSGGGASTPRFRWVAGGIANPKVPLIWTCGH